MLKFAIISTLTAVHAAPDASDACAAATTCDACTGAAGCGWCDGHAFDPSGAIAACLSLTSNTTWRCDGQFKNKGQCKCSGTDVPVAILFPWRGFYIDGTAKGEVALDFSNIGTNQGRAVMKVRRWCLELGVKRPAQACTGLEGSKLVTTMEMIEASSLWTDGGWYRTGRQCDDLQWLSEGRAAVQL